jgi:hypothetical protein
MATARVPIGNTLYEIDINVDGESDSPGISIGPSDTIEFHNMAPFPVSIQFVCANGPVFNNIASIAANKTSAGQSPQKSEITTNYYIVNLNTNVSQGPYSIEVGINTDTVPAPLLIPITAGSPPVNQVQVAVPQNGWIQFNLDDKYQISWSPAGIFPSGTIGPGLVAAYQAENGNANANASYTLGAAGTITGTVKINS